MAGGCDNSDEPCAVPNHTLWIAPHHGTVQIMEIPDLIVPRQDGFWRVGVRTYCDAVESDDDDSHDGPVFDDTWFAGRVSERPVAQDLENGAAEGLTTCPKDVKVDDSCGAESLAVAFVNGEYISFTGQGEQDCGGAHPGAGATGVVGRYDDYYLSPITYSAMEGRGASDTFQDAGALAQIENRVGYPEESGTLKQLREKYPTWDRMTVREKLAALEATVDDFCGGEMNEQYWYFEREQGKWAAHSTVGLPHVCGDFLPFDLPFHPPFATSFTGPISLDNIRRLVPDAYDAIWSPKREMVAVLVGLNKPSGAKGPLHTSLQVFLPHGQDLGKPISTLATGTSIGPVMAEWATGPSVARWSAELTKIKAQGVVQPRLFTK